MKKIIVLLMAFGFFVAACNNNKTGKNVNTNNRDKDDYGKNDNVNVTDDNKSNDNSGNSSWTETDKNKFLKECVEALDKSQPGLANQICPCVLQKMEKEFSSYSEADSKGGEAAGQRIALQCKEEIGGNNSNTNNNTNVSSNWPQSERDGFVSNCVRTAMEKGRTRTVAQNYCDCMLNKMESLFPDINEAAKLTEEDFNSPAMEKMAADCLKEN